MAKKKKPADSAFLGGYIPASQPIPQDTIDNQYPAKELTAESGFFSKYPLLKFNGLVRVNDSNSAVTGGSATIVTVPADQTMFVYSLSLSNTNASSAIISIINSTGGIKYALYTTTSNTSLSISPDMPLILEGGSKIDVISGGTGPCSGSVAGYLVPRSELIQNGINLTINIT